MRIGPGIRLFGLLTSLSLASCERPGTGAPDAGACSADPDCPAGSVCEKGGCVPGCPGAACGTDEGCVKARCYPRDCNDQDCSEGSVCWSERCTTEPCVGVRCDAQTKCVAGSCYPQDCPSADCDPDSACFQGACVEDRCIGVVCAQGYACSGGACVPCLDASGQPSDLLTDPLNCGACGKPCPTPLHAQARCEAGRCGRGPCEAGFFDFDAAATFGCEVECAAGVCTDPSGTTTVVASDPIPEAGLLFSTTSSGGALFDQAQSSDAFRHSGLTGEPTPLLDDGAVEAASTDLVGRTGFLSLTGP